jgi:hypothetical protein
MAKLFTVFILKFPNIITDVRNSKYDESVEILQNLLSILLCSHIVAFLKNGPNRWTKTSQKKQTDWATDITLIKLQVTFVCNTVAFFHNIVIQM